MSRARIMHVTDLRGENPWFNGMAEHHDRARFHQSLATLGPPGTLHDALEARGMPAYSLGVARRSGYPVAVTRLRSLLVRQRVDLVQTHGFYPSLIGLAAGALAGTRRKVVTRHHSDFTTVFDRPVHRQLDRLQARWADRVVAASAAVARAMVRYERVPPEKITVAPYGYDFTVLRPRLSPAARDAVRDGLHAGGRTLVANVARLSREKGHRDLLTALASLIGRHPSLMVVLVGDGPLRHELEAEVDRLGLREAVRFVGWRRDAWDIMEASDLVVHPSLTEAFSSVIIEAMALERPIVATDVAGAPEQIDADETGFLVPAQDPDALGAAIERVLAAPDAASAMGREARRRVVERFGFPRMMARYETVYDELLGVGTGTRP